jgi:8-oxo-dGTP diphosphatase
MGVVQDESATLRGGYCHAIPLNPVLLISMQELPHRRAARIVVLDAQGRVLLFRHAGSHGRSFWATPGGGLDDGETFEQAACREASEELGVTSMSLRLLWEATNDFVHVAHPVRQQERYFLMEGAG